jgi:hypothetical protein
VGSGSSGGSISSGASAGGEVAYSFQSSLALDINQQGVCSTFGGLNFGISQDASISSFSHGNGANGGVSITKDQCTSSFLDTFTVTIGDYTCVGKGATYSSKGWKCPCSGGSADYELYFQAGSDISLQTYASYSAMASQEWDFDFYASASASVQVLSLNKPTRSGGCKNGSSCTLNYSKSGKCQG